ncbi:MAG TPA: winged helix-turn-helix domain-containing protein [Steroidobacteraceae bacterium]|nr:winged helix-turn-helix domain-containing protein [Steroidobacteraceae bacterium]
MPMIYQFGPFELDMAKVELRARDATYALEPQVFALLALLVQNHDRLVSKDEIIEKVWDGRVVSDAAVASRIKSARQALGDDGKSQTYIKTVHRQGFRFVANVRATSGTATGPVALAGPVTAAEGEGIANQPPDSATRPSLAVLPFRLMGEGGRYAALSFALPAELITELSRLRWLFVTARGSSFRLGASDIDVGDIGRLLRVRYCLGGTIELSDRGLAVAVELVDTADGGIVWAERFSGLIDDVHAMREDIRSRVLTALEIQIPIHEAALARLGSTENLDAWSAYHLALQHMYRFNSVDNAAASTLFQRAVALDPLFARAHAGLSFIHFQTAFMRFTEDTAAETALARRFAERGLELDPLDPFVNFTMGRTYWLEGDLESSLSWLKRSTSISPHYAQGIYARAWTEALSGRPQEGRGHVDLAMRLSPLDPLYYAMLGTRSFTHMAVNEDAEAAHWGEQAARSPGAHVLIAMIAAVAHTLNGDPVRAERWAANVRARDAAMTRDHFCRAFPMKSDAMQARVFEALARLGF